MNTLIILPGNSPKNKAWGEGVAASFGGWFDTVYQQSYTHWETGAEVIDFDLEAEKLRDFVGNAEGTNTRYFIFAKSFGSILALMAIHRNYVHPEQCVFFGMPFNLVRDQNIFKGEWAPLSSLSIPSLAFHNERDPVANFLYTKEKLAELPSMTLVPTEGDDHGYFEFPTYESNIRDFLKL